MEQTLQQQHSHLLLPLFQAPSSPTSKLEASPSEQRQPSRTTWLKSLSVNPWNCQRTLIDRSGESNSSNNLSNDRDDVGGTCTSTCPDLSSPLSLPLQPPLLRQQCCCPHPVHTVRV